MGAFDTVLFTSYTSNFQYLDYHLRSISNLKSDLCCIIKLIISNSFYSFVEHKNIKSYVNTNTFQN
jgi:hypothetical protein